MFIVPKYMLDTPTLNHIKFTYSGLIYTADAIRIALCVLLDRSSYEAHDIFEAIREDYISDMDAHGVDYVDDPQVWNELYNLVTIKLAEELLVAINNEPLLHPLLTMDIDTIATWYGNYVISFTYTPSMCRIPYLNRQEWNKVDFNTFNFIPPTTPTT